MKFLLTSAGRVLLANGKLLQVGQPSTTVPDEPEDPVPEGPGATLTVTDFALDRYIFQRVGTGKEITVSGTTTAAATIQARTVDAESGVALTSWTTVATPTEAGVYSGTHQVPKGAKGKFYKLQVRDAAAPSTVFATTKRFSVGVRGILAGQSNMVGLPNGVSKYPLGGKGSHEYRGSAIKRVGNVNDAVAANTHFGAGGYGSYTTESGAKTGDGYVYLANMLADALDTNVLLIERAAGGTSIDSWMTGQSSWTPLANTMAEIGNDAEFALWLQGENDAGTGMSTATMVTKLGALHGQFKALTGRDDSNFHFGVLSLGPVSTTSSYAGSSTSKFGAIRAAHVQYANNTPGAFYVTGMHDTHTSDGVHIQGEGYYRAGRRMGKTVTARLGVGTSCAGPRVVSASRAGSVVTLTLQHSGGTALLDGAGGTGTALTGFEFKDSGGSVLTYTSSIASATTLQFTVSGTPATVSYAMMNAPHSTDQGVSTTAPVLASIVYDNATYLDGVAAPFGLSAVGAPLQPCPAITITGS